MGLLHVAMRRPQKKVRSFAWLPACVQRRARHAGGERPQRRPFSGPPPIDGSRSKRFVCQRRRPFPPHSPQGQKGNAAQYMTRNQALKKLQLKLSEFRCVKQVFGGSSRRGSGVPANAAPPPLCRPGRNTAQSWLCVCVRSAVKKTLQTPRPAPHFLTHFF